MKTGFKDPIGIEDGKNVRNPWKQEQVPYDKRTSCYTDYGTNYGVGHNQPVGKFKSGPYAVPSGKVNTMKSDYVNRSRPDKVEVEEKG